MTLNHWFLKIQNEGNPDFFNSHSNLIHIMISVNEYARRWGKQEKKEEYLDTSEWTKSV